MKISRNKIYLDCAATTPMDIEVKKAMEPYFCEKFGNPSSLHSFGQEAMAAVDESREKIAKAIGADFREIIFTGSATEANNLALRGVVRAIQNYECIRIYKNDKNKFVDFVDSDKFVAWDRLRIIVSAIEHESILETALDLKREGIEVIYLPVNRQGLVDLKKLEESLNERTVLVSIIYANNEIGTIQTISVIAEIVRKFRMQNAELRSKNKNSKFLIHNSELAMAYPLLHTDAVQAFQFLDCDVNNLGVDLMTLSAHKIYGPKGVGLLYRRIQNLELRIKNSGGNFIVPTITGGGQEFGWRSGTENVAAIVGFAKAIELAVQNRKKEFKKIKGLADYFWKKIKKIFPKAELNGIMNNEYRLPNILNIYFPDDNAQDLLMKLDLNGIAVSSGSACSARATKLSHVLKAISLSDKKIKNSLRFSLGKFTTKKEIDNAIKIMKKVI